VVLGIIGAIVGPSKKGTSASPVTTPSFTPQSQNFGSPTPSPAPPAPNAKASYTLVAADYSIPSGIYQPVYLTGEIDVSNTGNVGIRVRCKLGWQELGSPDATMTITHKVPIGAQKRFIYKLNVGSFSGNGQTVINNIQSWQNGNSGQFGHDHCTILSTYGTPS
jgi:hypothetical protein